MTKAEQLAAGLDDFLSVSLDVEAAAVVSADGLPMASALPPHIEEDRLAAMSAALLTLGERAATGLGKGRLAQVFVESGDGYVVLMSAGPAAVLVAITSGTAKVGLVLFEMRRASARIMQIMDGDRTGAGFEAEVAPSPTTNGSGPEGVPDALQENGAPPLFPEAPPPSETAFSTWH